jgi:hypothetical protein
MPRQMIDISGIAIDVGNVKYFEKVRSTDGVPGLKLIFWSDAHKTIWFHTTYERDDSYKKLMKGVK